MRDAGAGRRRRGPRPRARGGLLAAGREGLWCGLGGEGLGRRGQLGGDEAFADEDAGDQEEEHPAKREQQHAFGEVFRGMGLLASVKARA